MKKEEEMVPRIQEEVLRGQRAIMNVGVKEVGRLTELDTLPEASMEEYNKRLGRRQEDDGGAGGGQAGCETAC